MLMALSTPHRYYAESRLFVDPREIRVTEDDIRNQQLSTEAMLAITDSQLQILSSTSVLEKVIEDLGLDRDPEFNGSMAPGGISGGFSLIRELFTGKNPATEGEQKALNNLRDALSVGRDARTFVIIVGVDTRDPEKSALIANQIVETYLDSEGQAQSNLLERTSESIDTRINSLRADLDAAEREVERFKAENGLVGVGGQYTSQGKAEQSKENHRFAPDMVRQQPEGYLQHRLAQAVDAHGDAYQRSGTALIGWRIDGQHRQHQKQAQHTKDIQQR